MGGGQPALLTTIVFSLNFESERRQTGSHCVQVYQKGLCKIELEHRPFGTERKDSLCSSGVAFCSCRMEGSTAQRVLGGMNELWPFVEDSPDHVLLAVPRQGYEFLFGGLFRFSSLGSHAQ